MSETKVQRYDDVIEYDRGDTTYSMKARDNGDYVRWEDHEKALAIARAEGTREGLRNAAARTLATSSSIDEYVCAIQGPEACDDLHDAIRFSRGAIALLLETLQKMAREVKP